MNFLTKSNIDAVYNDTAAALKAVSRNRTASKTRVAIWNAFFSETPLSLSTSLRHIMITSFHKYLSGGPTDLFCFELSVLFFDLPIHFFELTSLFPVPLSIAMRNAYKVVNGHLQMPNQESMSNLIKNLIQTLPREKLPIFTATLQAIFWDRSNIDTYVDQMKKLLEPACFDSFLEAMPPIPRLRYALRYDRPPPKVNIDYHKLEMPIEFIQAIAEIDGCSEARNLSLTKDLRSFIESDDENEPESDSYSDFYSSSDVTVIKSNDTSNLPDDTSNKPDDTSNKPDDTFNEPDNTSNILNNASNKSDDTSNKLDDTFNDPVDTSNIHDDISNIHDDTSNIHDYTSNIHNDTSNIPDNAFNESNTEINPIQENQTLNSINETNNNDDI